MEIVAMGDEHVLDAAALLQSRLVRERDGGQPWRDEVNGDPASFSDLIARGIATTDGYVALQERRVVGFIQAAERSGPWPPSYWVGADQHAAEDAAAYRALYAAAAERWLRQGRLDHYIEVPPVDDLPWIFFSLGFGLEQVYAIRSLDDVEVRVTEADVRLATPGDLHLLKDLFEVLPLYQQGSPTFGLNTITREELHEGHLELLEDPSIDYWIASVEGRAVGFMVMQPVDPEDTPYLPKRTTSLDMAAVAEDVRGRGIGSALTSAALTLAAQQGYTHCVTDWRSANPVSGPTWTRWGFEPYGYRLHRTVDARLAER